ncbi:MAG TPA: hypothetical protein VL068_10660 [Microthrixaceae bacterium]|nr:hypothetical protein [Microthrixaceae bacterium]
MDIRAFRLFLHVFAASIWVGGQFVMLALLPTVREIGGDAAKMAGKAFNRLAWPAYGVLIATGIWNILERDIAYLQHPWIEIKVLAAVLSGVGAAMHQLAKGNVAMLAIGGAMSSILAVVAMYMGFLV